MNEESRQDGFTLIETMIVVIVLAVAMGIVGFSIRRANRLEDAARKIAGTGRGLFDEAAIKNMTLRMAYDLDKQTWWLEAYEGIYKVTARARENLEVEKEEEEKRREEEEIKEKYASEAPPEAAPVKKFVPVSFGFLEPEALPSGIKIAQVETPQLKEPVTKGMAYTHYFPGGFAEETVLQLVSEAQDEFLTIAVDPMTGNSHIYPGRKNRADLEDTKVDAE